MCSLLAPAKRDSLSAEESHLHEFSYMGAIVSALGTEAWFGFLPQLCAWFPPLSLSLLSVRHLQNLPVGLEPYHAEV